jgi:hypothetical protein
VSAAVRELFVYWRLEPQDLGAARRAMQQFQQQLQAEWPGLTARLYLRADEDGAAHATLMETYACEGGNALVPRSAAGRGLRAAAALSGSAAWRYSASVIAWCGTPASSNTGPSGRQPTRR